MLGPREGIADFFDQRDFHWGAREPHALLYGFAGKANKLGLLGGYRYEPPEKWVSRRKEVTQQSIPHRWPRVPLYNDEYHENLGYYTSAPLERVVDVQLFYDRKSPFGGERYCSGIILNYENGSSRVVGLVGLAKDSRASIVGEKVIHPKLICMELSDFISFDNQSIHFLTEAEIGEGLHTVDTKHCYLPCPRFPKQNNVCYRMEGSIDWWFTADGKMRVEIRKPEVVVM